jgi:multidrug efflux pump subunit AcrB
VIEDLRAKIGDLGTGADVKFEIYAGGPPVGKPIVMRVIGEDDRSRRALAARVAELLADVEGVKDVVSDDKPGKEQIEIRFDYPRLARLGLTVADVAQSVRVAYDGEVVTSLRQGDEDVEFRVQLIPEARRDLNYLLNLSVPNVQNRLIPLRQVASLETSVGPDAFRHFDGVRTVTVQADLDQDVATPLDATNLVLGQIDMGNWPGLRLEIGGEAEESAESITNLALTFLVAVIGMYFLLVLLFNSFAQPLLVLVSVPFGIVGVIIVFALRGESLGFMAVMGTIGLAGVVVNDSLVLVNHLNNLRRWTPEVPPLRLVGEGTSHRLRAIILTTLTTVAGLLPLAYGIGGTDIFMAPMALALGWGLVFATPLTLVLIPCLYVIGIDIARLFGKGGPPQTAA